MNKDYIELLQDENTGEFYKPYATIVCKTEEDFKNMQEALEKQTAKKPLVKWNLYKCCICNGVVYEQKYNYKYSYCSNCGQKQDWSEVDGKI